MAKPDRLLLYPMANSKSFRRPRTPCPESRPPRPTRPPWCRASAPAADGEADAVGGEARARRRPRRERPPTEPRLLEVLARPDGLELRQLGHAVRPAADCLQAHRVGPRAGRHARRIYGPAAALRPCDRCMDRSHRPQAAHDRGRCSLRVDDRLRTPRVRLWAPLALVDLRGRVRLIDALHLLLRRGVRRDPEPRRFHRARYRQWPD